MIITTLTGPELTNVLADLATGDVRTLRVSQGPDGLMVKVNEGIWSVPLGTTTGTAAR